MKTYHPSNSDEPIEVDVFTLDWTDPDERAAVYVQLWRRRADLIMDVVYFDTFEIHQRCPVVEEWAGLGPVPIEEAPWWLEEKLREEIGEVK